MIDIISIRLAHWVSMEESFHGISIDNLIRDLPNIINSGPPYPVSFHHSWSPPLGAAMKLNFDGCSLRNSGPSGCGGLLSYASGARVVAYQVPWGRGMRSKQKLRNYWWVCIFSTPEAIYIFLVVEGDSAIVIGQMKSGNLGPWRISHLIKEAVFLTSTLNISFFWIPRG